MDRWFCSNPFIPSITPILPFILETFPLLNLRHAISPCAEANTDTPAPARGDFTLRRHVAAGSRGRVWTCCSAAAPLPQLLHAPPRADACVDTDASCGEDTDRCRRCGGDGCDDDTDRRYHRRRHRQRQYTSANVSLCTGAAVPLAENTLANADKLTLVSATGLSIR